MKNLNKIIKIAKSFKEQFGNTIEGLGYNTIVLMLEKEDNSAPSTIIDMHKEIVLKLRKHGIEKTYTHLKVETYGDRVDYEIYLLDKSIRERTPAKFIKACFLIIEKEAENYKKKEAEKLKDADIALS